MIPKSDEAVVEAPPEAPEASAPPNPPDQFGGKVVESLTVPGSNKTNPSDGTNTGQDKADSSGDNSDVNAPNVTWEGRPVQEYTNQANKVGPRP